MSHTSISENFCSISTLARAVLLTGCVLLMAACDIRDPVWREYEEDTTRVMPSRGQMMPRQSTAEKPATLKWTAPAGWKEQPGSSMRLASFNIEQGSRTGLCTIIKLGGAAGGVDANVKRWIGQIEMVVPPADEFAAFIAKQENLTSAGGLDFVLVDLTKLGKQGPEQNSMIGSIFSLGDVTIFVKLTGPVALLNEQKSAFTALCKSLSRGDG